MTTTVGDAVRRRAARLVSGVLTVLLAAASGCGQTQPDREEESMETSTEDVPRPDVEYDVEVTPGDESVAVSWTLTNTGDEPLLVVDRVPRASGGTRVLDPQVAYVVGGSDGLVLVESRLYEMPETDRMSWAQLPVAGATELAPGQSLQRDLAVPLPLERLSPWGDDLGDGPVGLPDPVTSVQYCLGVVAGEPEPSWGLERVGDVVTLEHGHGAVAAQHVLCSDPTPLG